jgi:hypothetical protein
MLLGVVESGGMGTTGRGAIWSSRRPQRSSGRRALSKNQSPNNCLGHSLHKAMSPYQQVRAMHTVEREEPTIMATPTYVGIDVDQDVLREVAC